MLQCAAVCCSVLQCGAVLCVEGGRHVGDLISLEGSSQVCCSILQCAVECCGVLQCGAVCCSVLQCYVCEVASERLEQSSGD